MSKEYILKNLYSVWGDKPLDYLFQNEIEQFHADLETENISEDEYKEYARSQRREVK